MFIKSLAVLTIIPMTFSIAYGRTQQVPKVLKALKQINTTQTFVLQNAKGTITFNSKKATTPENWFNLSPVDGSEGVRTEEVYKTFGEPTDEVIVAVIDSGVDVNHEDLQGKIWINSDEIANNGIDDDKNGYIDDVFGWNFIGGSQGMASIQDDASLENGIRLIKGATEAQVNNDSLEVTRELSRMKKLKIQVEELGEELTSTQSAYLQKLEKTVGDSIAEATKQLGVFKERLLTFQTSAAVLKEQGLSILTLESVRDFVPSTESGTIAKKNLMTLLSNGQHEERLKDIVEHFSLQLNFHFNENFNPRSVVRDNYADQNERIYGNNDVIGPDSHHGTHVSGIIAAKRDNTLGMKGVASKVKIMAIRVVPNGDERDKDVANGIRYAVDNGAKMINMSFGKAFSPYKKVVDEAVRYAESKGVLLLHAAGNDHKDNDVLVSYPSRSDKAGKEFSNWLEIGASSFEKGLKLPATFSNFGKKTVDFFAPGVDIYSTTPDNQYDTYSGTSMATPAAAGVAALILSYKSDLDMKGLKGLMIDTSRRYPQLSVKVPSTETLVLFSQLSTYGSVVDAFEAVSSIK